MCVAIYVAIDMTTYVHRWPCMASDGLCITYIIWPVHGPGPPYYTHIYIYIYNIYIYIYVYIYICYIFIYI